MSCSSSYKSLLSVIGCLVVIAIATASADTMSSGTPKRDICPKNMPCKWAVCPWGRQSLIPNKESCTMIVNEACRCPHGFTCTRDLMEPLAAQGSPFIKHEYRCSIAVNDVNRNWEFVGEQRKRFANFMEQY